MAETQKYLVFIFFHLEVVGARVMTQRSQRRCQQAGQLNGSSIESPSLSSISIAIYLDPGDIRLLFLFF